MDKKDWSKGRFKSLLFSSNSDFMNSMKNRGFPIYQIDWTNVTLIDINSMVNISISKFKRSKFFHKEKVLALKLSENSIYIGYAFPHFIYVFCLTWVQ